MIFAKRKPTIYPHTGDAATTQIKASKRQRILQVCEGCWETCYAKYVTDKGAIYCGKCAKERGID